MTTRRLALIAGLAALIATPALAQKSASQLEWEAKQAELLAANLKEKGWKATASGLQHRMVSKPKPKGKQPTAASTVVVKYEGQTLTGVQFDASPEGETVEMPLQELVPGWIEAVPMMRVGETWEFVLPAALGYGDRSRPKIPAGSALRFKIELVEVK